MTRTDDSTEIAVFHACGSGHLTVTEEHDGYGYTFRITGRTNTLTISDGEAAALAQTLLERTTASCSAEQHR